MRPVNFQLMMFTIFDYLEALLQSNQSQVHRNYFLINYGRFCKLKRPELRTQSSKLPKIFLLKCLPVTVAISWLSFMFNPFDSRLSSRPLALTSLPHFFWIVFEGKYFTCYILITDQISLFSCLYFVRYWAICVLQMFLDLVAT